MRSNQLFTLLFFLIVAVGLHAQEHQIKGRISIFNSKLSHQSVQYIKDAEVITAASVPVSSDYKGRFQIKFNGLPTNTTIKIDVLKEGYEIVNLHDLEAFPISQTLLLRVYLAEIGFLAKEKEKLEKARFQILETKEAFFLDRLAFDNQESIAAIDDLEKRLGRKIYNTIEAEEIVLAISQQIQQQIPNFVEVLARINLDFAGETYRNAFEKYQSGKIEAAIATMENEDLESRLENILSLLKKYEANPEELKKVLEIRLIQMNQIKEILALLTVCYQENFQLKKAQRTFAQLEKVVSLTPFGDDWILKKLKPSTYLRENTELVNVVLENTSPTDSTTQNELLQSSTEEIVVVDSTKFFVAVDDKSAFKINSKTTQSGTLSVEKMDSTDFETALLLKEGFKKLESSATEKIPAKTKADDKMVAAAISTDTASVANANLTSSESVTEMTTAKKEVKATINEPSEKISSTPIFFRLTKKTSLRQRPTAKSKVLKRLAVGDSVAFIEKTNRYWDKVILNGQVGYVKSFLLDK
ncbi:MAG: SH3 domain-containing protein [Bacteroidota bacterium]